MVISDLEEKLSKNKVRTWHGIISCGVSGPINLVC